MSEISNKTGLNYRHLPTLVAISRNNYGLCRLAYSDIHNTAICQWMESPYYSFITKFRVVLKVDRIQTFVDQ